MGWEMGSGDDSEMGSVTKKGNQKSMTGIGASRSPDFRGKEKITAYCLK